MKKRIAGAILAAVLALSIIPVQIASALTIYNLIYSISGAATGNYGPWPSNSYAYSVFVSNFTGTVDVVQVHVFSIGSGSTVNISVETTAGGNPTGTKLGYCTISGANITGSSAAYNLTLNVPITLNAGTSYAITMGKGNGDASNYNKIDYDTSVNSSFHSGIWNGGFSDTANSTFPFKLYQAQTINIPVVSTGANLPDTSGNGHHFLYGAVSNYGGDTGVTKTGFLIGISSGNYSMNQTTTQNASSFNETITSNLTPGQRYYYKAEALNTAGWGYGLESSFVYSGYMQVTHTSVINATLPAGTHLFVGNINGASWTGNYTAEGYQVGSANGTWDFVGPLGNTLYQGSAETGAIYSLSAGFVAGQTYWFRPFCTGYDQNGLQQTFYGPANSFTDTGGTVVVPTVTTIGAFTSQTTPAPGANPTIVYNGGVSSSTTNLVQWGFVVGNTSALVQNTTAGGLVLQLLGSQAAPFPFTILNNSMPIGSVFFRAFAMDSAGSIGYGSVQNLTNTLPGQGNITVTGNNTTPQLNGSSLSGFVNNPGGRLISLWGFQWGYSSNNFTGAMSNTSSNPLYAFTTGFMLFNANSTVYWRAGVLPTGSTNWTWSSQYSFATGAAFSGNVTYNVPTVISHTANSSTQIDFRTVVEITNIGGSNITEMGIYWRLHNADPWTRAAVPSPNVAAANYTLNFGTYPIGSTVYYHAFATNSFGDGIGQDMFVTLGSTNPGGTGPTTGGTAQGFRDYLKGLMVSWGMDNDTGHWAFMGIWMMIDALIWIALIIYFSVAKYGELIVKITAVVFLMTEIVILGIFLFSGLLGWWPVFLLIFAVVGIIIIFAGNIFERGKPREA